MTEKVWNFLLLSLEKCRRGMMNENAQMMERTEDMEA